MLVLSAGLCVDALAQSGWLQYRGDRALTGRYAKECSIVKPQVKWKHSVRSRETLITFNTCESNAHEFALPASDLNVDAVHQILKDWRLLWNDADLDEAESKGIQISLSTGHTKIGKFLACESRLQKLQFDTGFTYGGDQSVPLRGRLYVREGREWVLLWETEPIPMLYIADPIVGDFDNDGNLEVAITPWYEVWVLDMATGKLKAKARYTPDGAESGRAYGWFGAFDIDKDGKQEFIILSDSENHMEVVGWKDGRLERLWGRLIERGVDRKQTALQVIPDPVQDVDGDGYPEIVVSILNEAGDNRWHTQVLDARTGHVKHDLPDEYISGLRDTDGDGVSEMFCTRTDGRLIPDRATLSVRSMKGNAQTIRWERRDSQFQTSLQGRLPANVNSSVYTSTYPMLIGSLRAGTNPVFITRDNDSNRPEQTKLKIWNADSGGVREIGSLQGPRLNAIAICDSKPGPGILVKAEADGDDSRLVRVRGGASGVLSSAARPAPLSPVTIGKMDIESSPTIVLQGPCEQLMAYQIDRIGNKPSIKWRVPGRGLFNGADLGGFSFGGAVMADLLGDDRLYVVAATRAPGGEARLVALDSRGNEIWHHDFAQLPGAPPPWNNGGIVMWFAGHFVDPGRSDIIVNTRPTNYNECYLLDGRTGEQIWHRKESLPNKSCGGSWMCVCDLDNDSLDDVICTWPNVTYALDGATGDLLLGLNTDWGGVFKTGSMGCAAIAANLDASGKRRIIYCGSRHVLAVLETDGTVVWEHGIASGVLPVPGGVLPGIGDIDGDSVMELLIPGCDSETGGKECRCYDAATGDTKWRLPTSGSSATSPITCDIDSDGKDEFIFGIGKTLYCVGSSKDGKSGNIRWKLDMPGQVGPISMADIHGDGRPVLVFMCGDGNVYGIGQ